MKSESTSQMISDEELKVLYLYVSTHSIDVSITKEQALCLIREVLVRRALSIEALTELRTARGY
jgi:hypothetical protein